MSSPYKAIVSSDWSECLSPSGPFDFIAFNHPELKGELARVFKHYTSNRITLSAATWQIQRLLPKGISVAQMDTYLDSGFATYRGVAELIAWCRDNRVLFMINTTGMAGYFQRAFARGLLPRVPALSAHPLVRFDEAGGKPDRYFELLEIEDKSKNTAAMVQAGDLADKPLLVMGDSGGDGPHFKWGHAQQAVLIASMMKPSLKKYCDDNGIAVDHRIGHVYEEGQERDLAKEMETDFTELIPIIERRLK